MIKTLTKTSAIICMAVDLRDNAENVPEWESAEFIEQAYGYYLTTRSVFYDPIPSNHSDVSQAVKVVFEELTGGV